jgi:hypothetical protein
MPNYRVQKTDPKGGYIFCGLGTHVDPEVVCGNHRSFVPMLLCEVPVASGHYPGHGTVLRQHAHLLGLESLIPKGMS